MIALVGSVLLALSFLTPIGWAATAEAFSGTEEAELTEMFERGQHEREAGNLYAALEIFRRLLERRPSFHRARLELAITQYQLLDVKSARNNAQLVLEDPDVPPRVKNAIRVFIGKVDTLEQQLDRPHIWQPTVNIGLLYDDNVDRPVTDVVGDANIGVAIPDAKPQSDGALVLTAGLTHRYQFSRSVRMKERAARAYWDTLASLYHRGYFSETDFNLDVLALSTGPTIRIPKRWRGGVALRGDYIRYGQEELAWYGSLVPTVTWELGRGELTWDAIYTRRDYIQEIDKGLTSNYWSTGATLSRSVMSKKLAIRGGARVFTEDAEDDSFSNDGTELFVSTSYKHNQVLDYYGKISLLRREYNAPQDTDSVAREEDQWDASLGATYQLPSTRLRGWTLGASYTYTDRDSNVERFDYHRNQLFISLGRSF